MADLKQAMIWLRSGKKVTRPSWQEGSYWVLGKDESITWMNGRHANIHLNQIDATDWKLFEEPKLKEPYKDVVTVMDLLNGLVNCDVDWRIEVQNRYGSKIPKTKIVAVKPDNEGLCCLFG